MARVLVFVGQPPAALANSAASLSGALQEITQDRRRAGRPAGGLTNIDRREAPGHSGLDDQTSDHLAQRQAPFKLPAHSQTTA